uniref:Protein TIC 214 n=1 Tax=Ranunculus glacialis TaxID=235900 RepID=A0A481Y1J4_RANGL|nr:hypothetical chloroplast RF19 [Oxygraphis glacialis]QBK49650.1 hypothetical chloroplast RF19 [Oxygraphis glacialis]
MILKYFSPLNHMKIINSVVVVGLYYGFLTTFSIGPSYLFLFRARVMEEGAEKEISATTGFIAGQLVMFISIYYAPLYLALCRPHTITVLVLPYLLFHFFWNNHKNYFFDSVSTTTNLMRNLSIQCIFLNNLIFQLLNHFILPSSTLARLVNIYMFRCNNKILFITSSFVGWLIGHILLMKWVGLVLVWIRQNHSIRSNKYVVSEFRNSMARIFSILLFITCVYYLGRMPSPLVTKKLKETSKKKDEFNFEFKEKYSKNGPVYKNFYLDQDNFELEIKKEKEEKKVFWFKKPLVTLLFDYKRWNRPLRYIKNDLFENAVRTELSQYFFYTCESDGKQKISFTYPPSLSTFLEMIHQKMFLCRTGKRSYEELYNNWVSTNNEKLKNISKEFINRIVVLDKGFLAMDVLEKRIRLCNDENEQECLPKIYDPLLNGPHRGKIKELNSRSSMNEYLIISIEDTKDTLWINKLHNLLPADYKEFQKKIDLFYEKSLLKDIDHLSTSISEFDGESITKLKELFLFSEQGRTYSQNKSKYLFDAIKPYSNDQIIRKKSIDEINKKVLQWSYKLIDDFEEQEEEKSEATKDRGIRSRKAKRVVIFTDNETNKNTTSNNNEVDEVALIRYSQQSNFRRDLIKGSMRAQRRKIVIWELFQATVHSPLFLDRIDKFFFLSFDTDRMFNFIFRNWMGERIEFKISDLEEQEAKAKKKKENERITIGETWDTFLFAQAIRGSMLVTQSILRKYVVLPSLIISKNIGRILVFQRSEWHEDFEDWSREMHVKCTYNGVQLSETEFPKNWLTDGIQIKILFPFCLKPWHRSNRKSQDSMKNKENSCFLTIFGMEAELPFGSPRKRPSFFEPIWKQLEKKLQKVKKKSFLLIKERRKWVLKISKEKKNWVTKKVQFIKKIIKELTKKSSIPLFGLKKVSELRKKTKKKWIISNKMIPESSIRIRSTDWISYSLTEKKIKDIADRTSIIRNQIEKITQDKKSIFITTDINIRPNERSYNDKRLEWSKIFCQLLKRGKDRLIRKCHYFWKFCIEKIYINIFLRIINISTKNVQILLQSKKKITNKYNGETKKKRIDKTTKNTIHFISIIKGSISKTTTNSSNKNSQIFYELSSFSQAYVFYKLSQIQVINKYSLKSLFQYHGTIPFIKDRIKIFFGTQGIFNSESRHQDFHDFGMNEWQSWLMGNDHYQYNLSQTSWSRLVPKKWKNRINQNFAVQNKNSTNFDLYEKEPLIHYEKQKDYAGNSLPNRKDKLKNYKYDFLSNKYIHYENKKNSSFYGLTLQVNQDRGIFYNYNPYNPEIIDLAGDLSNYLKEDYIRDQNPDRKYLDWRTLNFCLRKKSYITEWTNMDIGAGTNITKNTKTRTDYYYYYQIIDQMEKNKTDKKSFLNLAIHKQIDSSNQTKAFFDWMGMNEEIINWSISNRELWFLPELVLLYDVYKIQPWIIPINLLLLKFNINKNLSKKINETQKKDLRISYNQNKSLELENRNQEEKQEPVRGGLGSYVKNQKNLGSDPFKKQKEGKEDFDRLDIQKNTNKKKSKSNIAAELDFFLKKYFLFQLRWDNPLNQKIMNNIKIYCLLLRLINPKEIAISSIQRDEMSLDVMLIPKSTTLTKLLKRGLLLIDPARLSIKWDGEFIMYQTIAISQVHKSKHQKNVNNEKKGLTECIARHENLFGNRDENHYDFLVTENLLSPRRRIELRSQICLNLRNFKVVDQNQVFFNGNNTSNFDPLFYEDKHLDVETNKFLKFKFFLWPNYRLEDLACMNRYWFDTNNGSRFSMSRIHMYP